MSLSMSAYTTTEHLRKQVDFDVDEYEHLHFWCNHPSLHEQMRQIYDDKGGVDFDFNCVSVALNKSDISRLERAITTDALPTCVFPVFDDITDESTKADDLLFIANARKAIASGLTVIYSAWW